jgi:hypothetical protein
VLNLASEFTDGSAIAGEYWISLALSIAANAFFVWGLVELGLMCGMTGANRYGEDPLAPSTDRFRIARSEYRCAGCRRHRPPYPLIASVLVGCRLRKGVGQEQPRCGNCRRMNLFLRAPTNSRMSAKPNATIARDHLGAFRMTRYPKPLA